MDVEGLEEFITKTMEMNHVYQPILIMAMLDSGDLTTSAEEIANKIAGGGEPGPGYYAGRIRKNPQEVLANHGVIVVEGSRYRLDLDEDLPTSDRERLRQLCENRLTEYIDRDKWISWFRKLDKTSITSELKAKVLAKSHGICVMCGSVGSDKTIDHIVPRHEGGRTKLGNLQALCDPCHLEKRRHDDIEFFKWYIRLKEGRKNDCPICDDKRRTLVNGKAHALHPKHLDPDGDHDPMHMLVAPHRHVRRLGDLTYAERRQFLSMVDDVTGYVRGITDTGEFAVEGMDREMDHFYVDVMPVLSAGSGAGGLARNVR